MAPEAASEGDIGDAADGEVEAGVPVGIQVCGIPDLGDGVGFGVEAGVGRWLEGSSWWPESLVAGLSRFNPGSGELEPADGHITPIRAGEQGMAAGYHYSVEWNWLAAWGGEGR